MPRLQFCAHDISLATRHFLLFANEARYAWGQQAANSHGGEPMATDVASSPLTCP